MYCLGFLHCGSQFKFVWHISKQYVTQGIPTGCASIENSRSCRTKQSDEQLKLLEKARLIPPTTVTSISAEIERRKMLDYEIDQEQEDWETEENNEEETQENPLLSAINWSAES